MLLKIDSTKFIPLYVLCYLFDTNELTNTVLKNTKEETAQYSLHVVGLVTNHLNKTIIIADSNGALIGTQSRYHSWILVASLILSNSAPRELR